MNSWMSLIPPIIAIVMAILTRQVVLSLVVGIFTGAVIIEHFNLYQSFAGSLEIIIDVFKEAGNTRNIVFSLLIGAIIFLVQSSGGVKGFVRWIANMKIMNNQKQSGLWAIFIGAILFIESNISILTVGTIFKPIFKKFKISKEKLAYIADSSCAPMKVLIPLNAWGAYIIAQLELGNVANPTSVFVSSIAFNVYPIIAMLIVINMVVFNINIGPMKQFEANIQSADSDQNEETVIHPDGKASYFIVPMVVLVGGLFMFMFITGDGVLTNGSGSKSILYSVVLTLLVMYGMYMHQKVMDTKEFMNQVYKGMGHLLEIAIILMLAFAINTVCRELGTGLYVAQIVSDNISQPLMPALLFIISAFVAFSTGTSWGTFAIMLAIGVPVALSLDLYVPLIVGAIVSGGVWGDHCSPISDTTVISSLASDSNHIDHVKSQLPYALAGGGITIIIFLFLGFLL